MNDEQTTMKPFERVVHELKTWPVFFDAILSEEKPFEARKDDRGFEVGHDLKLREWNPETQEYTGRTIVTGITYILRGTEHVAKGYCILGLTGGSNSQASLKYRLESTQREFDKFQDAHAKLLIAHIEQGQHLDSLRTQLREAQEQYGILKRCSELQTQTIEELRSQVARLTGERDTFDERMRIVVDEYNDEHKQAAKLRAELSQAQRQRDEKQKALMDLAVISVEKFSKLESYVIHKLDCKVTTDDVCSEAECNCGLYALLNP